MNDPILSPGDKLHIITRRLYADDLRRHFVGEVIRAEGDLCEIKGYAFVFNSTMNRYEQRETLRTRLFRLGDGFQIVNKLPLETAVDKLAYSVVDQRLMLVDTTPTSEFKLDINEFNHTS